MRYKVETITDALSYIPASEEPLSADVGIFYTENRIWLFDVGNGEKTIEAIEGSFAKLQNGQPVDARTLQHNRIPLSIVISHFHPDHMGNIGNFAGADIYVGANTAKYLDDVVCSKNHIITVTEDVFIDDVHVFPLPSSHAKGSLGLEIAGKYAWLGDGAYTCMKGGKKCYNAGILKEEIEVLERLHAEYVLLSHQKQIVRPKDTVVGWLKSIYKSRIDNEPYVYV